MKWLKIIIVLVSVTSGVYQIYQNAVLMMFTHIMIIGRTMSAVQSFNIAKIPGPGIHDVKILFNLSHEEPKKNWMHVEVVNRVTGHTDMVYTRPYLGQEPPAIKWMGPQDLVIYDSKQHDWPQSDGVTIHYEPVN
jgi:hypothetical protein